MLAKLPILVAANGARHVFPDLVERPSVAGTGGDQHWPVRRQTDTASQLRIMENYPAFLAEIGTHHIPTGRSFDRKGANHPCLFVSGHVAVKLVSSRSRMEPGHLPGSPWW